MIKFRLNTSDDWWRARFVSTGSFVGGLHVDGAHAVPYRPVSPLPYLLCFLYFSDSKRHLAAVSGSLFSALPADMGSDRADWTRILYFDGGGTFQIGAGEIQRAVYSGSLGAVRQPGDFGKHLRHQLVAADQTQLAAAIQDHVLHAGNGARSQHRAGHLYRPNSMFLKPFPGETEPERPRPRPGVFHLLSEPHVCDADAQPVRFAPGGYSEHSAAGHYRRQCSGLADPAAGGGRRYAARAGAVRERGREPAFDALGVAQRRAFASFGALGTGNPSGSRPLLRDLPGCSLGFKLCYLVPPLRPGRLHREGIADNL